MVAGGEDEVGILATIDIDREIETRKQTGLTQYIRSMVFQYGRADRRNYGQRWYGTALADPTRPCFSESRGA